MSDYTDEDVQVAMAAGEAIFAAPDDIADEYRAILDAVVPAIVRRAKAEALRELSNRLFRADVELGRMKHQTERITGKAEGVRLAQSYADETVREIEGQS